MGLSPLGSRMSARHVPMGRAHPHGHPRPTRPSLQTPAQSAPNPIHIPDPARPRPTPMRPPRPCTTHVWPRVARERARGASNVLERARPAPVARHPPWWKQVHIHLRQPVSSGLCVHLASQRSAAAIALSACRLQVTTGTLQVTAATLRVETCNERLPRQPSAVDLSA